MAALFVLPSENHRHLGLLGLFQGRRIVIFNHDNHDSMVADWTGPRSPRRAPTVDPARHGRQFLGAAALDSYRYRFIAFHVCVIYGSPRLLSSISAVVRC